MGNIVKNIQGAFKDLFKNKEARILLLGLDGAGKTTLLYKVYSDENVETIPTIGFNVERVRYKKVEFTMWDIGGQVKIRRLWGQYFSNTDAVIFVVDSNDRERIREASDTLLNMLKDDRLKDCKLLVYANKQDLPYAVGASNMNDMMKLNKMKQDYFLQPCVALSGEGLYEGLDWLSSQL